MESAPVYTCINSYIINSDCSPDCFKELSSAHRVAADICEGLLLASAGPYEKHFMRWLSNSSVK